MPSFMIHKPGIFSRPYRALTIGIILAVTAVAFESLAVITVAPMLAEDLRGLELYGWVFSAYLLAQLTGTVITGQQVDRHGPAWPFVAALAIFGLGLITAGLAPNMPMVIGGRALQGFGAGALINCVYSCISLRYDDSLRAQILAVFSSAYIIPALLGPYVAGLVAERLSWRFVFWGLLPFLLLTAILTLPTFLRLTAKGNPGERGRVWPALQLALGTGLLLTGLGRLPQLVGVLLALGGLVLIVLPLRRLLPAGTLVARAGLPALVAARGLLMASYFGTETFLVLTLTTLKGYAADTTGLFVASGALSWSAAAWLQARLDRLDQGQGRRQRVLLGVSLTLVGIGAVTQVVWLPNEAIAWVMAGYLLMGLGIGLAHPTSSAIAFTQLTDRSEGAISADLQVADTFTPAVGIGTGDALVAISRASDWAISVGIVAALGVQFLLVLASLLAAFRLPHNHKGQIR